MVGIVLVSHSRLLAQGLVELIKQAVSPELKIAIAAGIGENRQDLGTDTTEIIEAIQTVFSPDGVLVLMDLGSALLSAEMALELLPDEQRSKVTLCSAPLVEGALSAAVQASSGNNLATVRLEAMNSLAPKMSQLGDQPMFETQSPGMEETNPPGTIEKKLTITLINQHGLHVRPAARFVNLVSKFEAMITVSNLTTGKGPVSARSLNNLATLGALQGQQIQIVARGEQAEAAIQSLAELVQDGFGEPAQKETESKQAIPTISEKTSVALQALPVSEGFALAPLFCYQQPPPLISSEEAKDPDEEWTSLQKALHLVKQNLAKRRHLLQSQVGEEQAAIFDAHQLILEDPDLLATVRNEIYSRGKNVAVAWQSTINQIIKNYQHLEDPYQQARSMDVGDVGNQVLNALSTNSAIQAIELQGRVIIYADQITPNEIASLDIEKVAGLVTISGSPTSHCAILARSLGIPTVSGIDLSGLNGTLIALDGTTGRLWVNPSPEVQTALVEEHETWLAKRQALWNTSHEPAIPRHGQRINVAANVGSILEAKAAVAQGADGIGVLRTEFLYLRRSLPPSEEEQLDTLLSIGKEMNGLPMIVRTLDAGGDKELPYLNLPGEANPFLGVRAIRLSLIQPGLFLTQLRAILRAGASYEMQIMFPMVANLAEIVKAKELLFQAHQQLEQESLSHKWPVITGIMVEIPSSALLSAALASQVDFFSIGTNDLTQYTLAAERGNPQLTDYLDSLHPAVLHQIKMVVEAAHQYNKWAGVCGEIASDSQATAILLGLGVDEFSMNPAAIPSIKATIRKIDLSLAEQLARKALQCTSADQVRSLCNEFPNLP
jgi:phosphoenolpyruvate-protein phosphotransferase/dihydroxyacetone kinase phosphotransfer subunit